MWGRSTTGLQKCSKGVQAAVLMSGHAALWRTISWLAGCLLTATHAATYVCCVCGGSLSPKVRLCRRSTQHGSSVSMWNFLPVLYEQGTKHGGGCRSDSTRKHHEGKGAARTDKCAMASNQQCLQGVPGKYLSACSQEETQGPRGSYSLWFSQIGSSKSSQTIGVYHQTILLVQVLVQVTVDCTTLRLMATGQRPTKVLVTISA